MGLIKAGTISTYFPTAVIEGMLVAIGIYHYYKELPHAMGYDKAHEGDWFSYELMSAERVFSLKSSCRQLCSFRSHYHYPGFVGNIDRF